MKPIYLAMLTIALTAPMPSLAANTKDSSSIQTQGVTPYQTPKMLDSGYYDFDGTFNDYLGYFRTNRVCPPSYSPYFTLTPNITWNPDNPAAFLLTPRSYTKHGSHYVVSFHKQYGQDSGGLAFTWVLYCYPPSIPVPGYLPYGGSF